MAETMELTTTEASRKTVLVHKVKAAIDGISEGGPALVELRDSRLYRDTHPDFETFCREVFGISKTHANRLIDAADIARDLTPIGVTLKESHVRELKSVPPEKRDEVVREAVESSPKKNGKPNVTAKDIRKAAEKVTVRRVEPDPVADTTPSVTPQPEAKPPDLDPEPWAQHNADAQRVIELMDEYVAIVERMAATPFGGWVEVKAHRALAKSTKANFEKWQVAGFRPQREVKPGGPNFYYAYEIRKSKGAA